MASGCWTELGGPPTSDEAHEVSLALLKCSCFTRSPVSPSLGFKVPAEIDQLAGDQFYTEISAERVGLLDADLLLWDQLSYLPGGRSTVEANPLVGQLDAMQDGRALFLPEELEYAFAFNTVLSLPFLLDGAVPMVETAADGDPATVPAN